MCMYKTSLGYALVMIAIVFLNPPSPAQSPKKKADVEQELVRTETGFFEAWKAKDQAYFRDHIPENGVFWGEAGTFSRPDYARLLGRLADEGF